MLWQARRPPKPPGYVRSASWSRVDLLGMAAGFLYTLTLTVVLSRGRIFWEDEMLAWMLLTDSWHHMLYAWRLGVDGGGFTFYLTARAWLYVFGTSELAFRLYSSVGFGLAFVIVWVAARRYYQTAVVAFALYNTWFFSPPFTLHMREGRFYGLLILAVSLTVWLTLLLGDWMGRVPTKHLVAMFLVHALLTTSHLLGVVFSALLLCALVVIDLSRRRVRPLLYCAGAASWLLLLFERSNITASAAVGKPHFWVRAPQLAGFAWAYVGWSSEIATVICVLLAATALALSSDGTLATELKIAFSRRRSVYIVVAALLLLPIFFVIEGWISTSLFAERYLLPINLALVFVTAEACTLLLTSSWLQRLGNRPSAFRYAATTFVSAFGACLLFWDLHHVRQFTPSALNYTDTLTHMLPTNLPVVVEDGLSFTELIGRQHNSGVRYVFLLDWREATAPNAPPVEVTQYHLMENWRRVGYFSGSIEPIDAFLRQHERFLVLYSGPRNTTVNPDLGNPLIERFRQDPHYEVRHYADLDRPGIIDSISLVCLSSCSPPTH